MSHQLKTHNVIQWFVVCISISFLCMQCSGHSKGSPQANESLRNAASKNKLKEVKSLLAKGADVNSINSSKMTALHYASAYNHLQVCKVLIAHGADVNAKNFKGMTPLHWPAKQGYIKIIKLLLKHDSDPHSKNNAGKTPIDLASSKEVKRILHMAGNSGKHEIYEGCY